jgi:hypothetical protein
MKTQRRHELQTNTLAVTLAQWIEAVKPYSRAGLALLVAAVVSVFAWGYLSAQGSRRQADGWNEYFEVLTTRDPRERLGEIAEQYIGTPVGEWSRLTLADIQLDDGTNRLFVEKKDARDELRQAAEKYQAILIESHEPMLLQRATFGLARAHEALAAVDKAQDTLDKAREEYLSIAKKWPGSPYAAPAEARAKDLAQPDTKSFYDWLARYEPPRPLAREPGTPGVKPDFVKDPLEGGGIKFPSLRGDDSPPPNSSDEAADGPSTDAPIDQAGKPASDKPAEPASDKPAEPPAASDSDELPPPKTAGGDELPAPKAAGGDELPAPK